MDRLKHAAITFDSSIEANLHSNMDRLKRAPLEGRSAPELIYIPIWID